MTFGEVWHTHIAVDFEPAPLPVIGLDELIKNKRAAGRPKDLADVAALEARRQGAPPKRRTRKTRTPQKKARSKHSPAPVKPPIERRTKKK